MSYIVSLAKIFLELVQNNNPMNDLWRAGNETFRFESNLVRSHSWIVITLRDVVAVWNGTFRFGSN